MPQTRFCGACGAQLVADAAFCHNCGQAVGAPVVGARSSGTGGSIRWGAPVAVLAAVAVLAWFALRMRGAVTIDTAAATAAAVGAPDISAMSPLERVDRLYNRVMQLASDGKTDSAAFFAPMALAAMQDLRPVTAHLRYDMGLVALAARNPGLAAAQSDTILAERSTHLLGLSLAARAADARGDTAAARVFRQRLLAAEQAELAAALPEYSDHDADLRDALRAARGG